MSYCLPKFAADEFKARAKSGEIDPAKLVGMTSAERHTFFEKFLSKDAALNTNALFESKLLLNNQQQGIVNWARTVTGLKPGVRNEIIDKVMRLDKVLTPEEESVFLHDLAQKRLGVDVSAEEANTIAALAKEADVKKTAIPESSPNGSKERLDYGAAKIAFDNYVNGLKLEAKSFTLADAKVAPVAAVGKSASFIAGLAKSMKATLDNSFLLRQNLKVLFAHPTVWAKRAAGSFELIAKQLGQRGTSNDVLDAVKAEVFSRENALNGTYKKMKLDIGSTEEAYPTTLPEKVPLLGRVFKASETAFTGTALRTRADLADMYMDIWRKAGVDPTKKEELESIGKLVNSLTGRGDLGRAEGFAKAINNLFFSPKFLKSNLDFLTVHALDKGFTKMARKRAAVNLVKGVAGIATILGIADAVAPGSVEWDPKSSDFGKIRVGKTRFDVAGGNAALVTLAVRLVTQESKSSTTKRITKIDSGKFGAPTTLSTLGSFMENKLSPAASSIISLRAHKNRNNQPIDLTTKKGTINLVSDTFLPLPITNYMELSKAKNAPVLAGIIADGLGVSTNTY